MRSWFLRLAQRPLVGVLLGWVFAYLSFALPVQRLRETDTLIAFHHPRPSYPTHILLVPKRKLSSMMALAAADADFLIDLFQTVQDLVRELALEQGGYRLISNGGAYQDTPHLHFHLIGGEPAGGTRSS